MNPIRKLLSVGDVVYSATGKEMTVTAIDDKGFETVEDYFFQRSPQAVLFNEVWL